MRAVIVLLIVLGLVAPAYAESCTRSREYILEGLAGDLRVSPAKYKQLYGVCMKTLALSNVKDAYILRDGGIAIVPARDTIFATAETLAEFCRLFPNNVARFVSRRERRSRQVALIVTSSSARATPCRQLLGNM